MIARIYLTFNFFYPKLLIIPLSSSAGWFCKLSSVCLSVNTGYRKFTIDRLCKTSIWKSRPNFFTSIIPPLSQPVYSIADDTTVKAH